MTNSDKLNQLTNSKIRLIVRDGKSIIFDNIVKLTSNNGFFKAAGFEINPDDCKINNHNVRISY